MGLGQYNSLGEYCGPHTASAVFLILIFPTKFLMKTFSLLLQQVHFHTFSFSKKSMKSKTHTTVNVDIFACTHFRAFPKIDNFAQINIRVFDIFAIMLHYKSYFHDVHIYADI